MTRISITTAALLTLFAASAQAQQVGPVSLDVRAGSGVATRNFAGQDLEPGYALEFTANLHVLPHVDLYVGHSQVHFGLDQAVGVYDEFEDCGYAFGARFYAPSFGPVTPWIRAGGLYNQAELETDDADDYVDSGHELGWEAGAGAAVALGGRWSLLPGVRYRSLRPELAELGSELKLDYLTFDLGISATFGGASMATAGHR